MILGKTNNELPPAKTINYWKAKDKKYKVHRVKKIELHGGYLRDNWMNDIAIVTVKPPFKIRKATKLASLPKANNSLNGKLLIFILRIYSLLNGRLV